MLMPSDDVHIMVQEHGFSAGTIPLLCSRYNASSIAVAFQMIFTAVHHCYLVIAAPDYIAPENDLPLLVDNPPAEAQLRLVMLYTAASPAAKYSLKRGQIVPGDNPISAAWHQEGSRTAGLRIMFRGCSSVPLSDVNQSVIRSRNPFSRPHPARLA